MDRVILHCDLNNFFASVECMLNPAYRDFPLAVCGSKEKRSGIILAKNELAKAYGVKTTDLIHEAVAKCPDILLVPPHYDEYAKYSKKVKDIYLNYTNLVESFGIDECWLDVTGSQNLFGNGETIANRIRQEVKSKLGLTISVGVSFNKTFAKLGSDLKKPDAVTLITRENYKDKLFNLDVRTMLFIGRKTAEKLRILNIKTIGDIANANPDLLNAHFGINGTKMIEYCNGIDNAPVKNYADTTQPKSVSQGTTLPFDTTDVNLIKTVIYFLSDIIGMRLRKYGLSAGGIALNVKDNKFEYFTKQQVLPIQTMTSELIAKAAIEIFNKIYSFKTHSPVRAITIGVYKLSDNFNSQLDFFADKVDTKNNSLETTIDKLRDKYGFKAIKRGSYASNEFIDDKFSDPRLVDESLIPFKRD